MQTLTFGPDDAARCRFAVSPLWETASAVRVLKSKQRHAYHLPWLDAVRPQLEQLDLAPLLTLKGLRLAWELDQKSNPQNPNPK